MLESNLGSTSVIKVLNSSKRFKAFCDAYVILRKITHAKEKFQDCLLWFVVVLKF